ncbi:MAG: protease inhibitor I42 family protein [Actinobacteria bacterium]|nr:protease inhibitor I42 family protein [Actinomycetota bacterium]
MTIARPARLLALTLTSLLVAGTVLAATPANAKPVDPTVIVTILPAQVRLVPRESVVIRLSTNLTTGYSWSYRVTGDASAVTVVQKKAAPPAADGLMGAPTTTDWVVTAKGKGTAVVKILTTPPGSTDKKKVGSLTVIVGN